MVFLSLLFILIGCKNTSLKKTDNFKLLPPPVFKYCSCDSATFCLNDEDVMKMNMWYENAKDFEEDQKDPHWLFY